MIEEPIHLGKRLKELQSKRNFSTGELAKMMGVHSQQVSRWHTQSDMKVSVLADICYWMEMSLDEFVFDD
jgi:transcriptional regulator with XRE-family HTH domain